MTLSTPAKLSIGILVLCIISSLAYLITSLFLRQWNPLLWINDEIRDALQNIEIDPKSSIDMDKWNDNIPKIESMLRKNADCDKDNMQPCIDFVPYICSEGGAKDFYSKEKKEFNKSNWEAYGFDCNEIQK